MRGWRVKGRDKLDFRASAELIKFHGMYENDTVRDVKHLYIRYKFEIN